MEFANRSVNSAHVLLLDARDEERIRYADALRGGGFLVTALADPESAYRLAVEAKPRVIVTCVNAGNRNDHLALCRRLKAGPPTLTIPTLLTSAKVSEEDIRLATAIGVLALAVTPADGAKLVSAVRGVLAVHERKQLPALPRDSEDFRRSA